jgi:hypothetical protein
MEESLAMLEIAPGTLFGFRRSDGLAGGLHHEGVEVALQGVRDQGGGTSGMMRTMNRSAALASLLAQSSFDAGSVCAPTLGA